MLIMPGFADRLIVLMAGVLMCAGAAYLVNRLRTMSERTKDP